MTAGMSISFLPLGGIIQEFRVGEQNIVLGFPTQELYEQHNTAHFGETIGRVANRIKNGVIANLNGREYTLAQNNGPNSLHGGVKGWGKCVFDGPLSVKRHDKDALLFTLRSQDGDQGFPGTLELRVWYTITTEADTVTKTVLEAEYEVEFVGDECEETVVNITNHSYFNLTGDPDLSGTIAQLSTDNYLPVDETGIPHGSIAPFPHKVTSPFTLGDSAPSIDDCFVMETDPTAVPKDTRPLPLKLLAAFHHPKNGIHLEVHSTEPAFQFYTGKYINVPAVAGLPAREPGSGFCVEPSRYVNAINEPEWRDMMLLRRGEVFACRNVYKAWINI
ncbi:hypothetical protein ASPZODRAFT_161596 [Penicilliopsis zonata CBS 506.65]|uniref:Aldose 1-epimerase n=1 Tax=Penicilliopsis zonata CBS 506.65 TaxID=1073090 RepID=A0A1L9S883_9EURO|nr:hypothetical protein ASPZODRAFT_161596 [Penicilliopsis zonata CBS 506.65]OJJ43368.1 hypothetical protein ASPZODRAFT_161596 [Penicilliopsis zonata CBS 506.65]